MAYYLDAEASNAADFVADISATDAITGDDIDFTGATASISIWEEGCRPKLTATIGSGITQPTAFVLELTITATQMTMFRAGSYLIGGTYTINGAKFQLIKGEFVVYDGEGSV